MFITFVYSFIYVPRFLSLYVIPSIFLSISLSVLFSHRSCSFVRCQVSKSCVSTGRMHWLYANASFQY